MGPPEPSGSALLIASTRAPLATDAVVARTWRARAQGLLGRTSLPAREALIFPRCRAIHTVGMRFPIDIIFVDRRWRVVAVRAHVPPGRPLVASWRAWGAIEMASGAVARAHLRLGDRLELVTQKSS